MKENKKVMYDDFYIAYFDSTGRIVFPSDIEEVKIIRSLLEGINSNHLVYAPNHKQCYKVRVKRKIYDGIMIQIVELSNVSEFIEQVNNASLDETTNLNNRKFAMDLFTQYIEYAYNNDESFSIILGDLDCFKDINDNYGHINGDIVLREISSILYRVTRQEKDREQDIVARIGGDEFLIVLKNVNKDFSIKRVEEIRTYIEKHRIRLFNEKDNSRYVSIGTMSMGLYYVTSGELQEIYQKGMNLEEIKTIIINRCDSALYFSKNNGKNRTTIYENGKVLKLTK